MWLQLERNVTLKKTKNIFLWYQEITDFYKALQLGDAINRRVVEYVIQAHAFWCVQ